MPHRILYAASLFLALQGCASDDSSSGAGSGGAGSGGSVSGVGANPGAGAGAPRGVGGADGCDQVADACPVPGGLTHACKTRFALGTNYAWHDFAADFGGLASWSQGGVSASLAVYSAELASMAAAHAQTVRWWMFPDFRGDGVIFDASGDPQGLSDGAVADIGAALELASEHDLYLVLTIFSFDNFRPTRDEGGVTIFGMTPMVKEPERRAKLMNNLVRPIARAVASSPHSERLLAWDVINEPEWAIAAEDGAPSGEQFTPNEELDSVSLDEMRTLIDEVSAILHEETSAPVSVGWAAAKWSWAFASMDSVDIDQPHIYAWVNDWWPYTQTPQELGYGAKPTVMGEFYLRPMPLSDSSGASYEEIVSAWYTNGFAGAWAWQYIENQDQLGLVTNFAQQHPCETVY